MIQPERIQILRDAPTRNSGKYVLYWMQQSQRTRWNHALEFAVEQANALKLPLRVLFGLMHDYPEANERHYAFMLDGLADVAQGLRERGISFEIKLGSPAKVAIAGSKDASLVVCDRGYLRHQKAWRDEVAAECKCRVVQVESDVVIPVEVVSDHAEFAARTIRPKIHKHLKRFLKPLKPRVVVHRESGKPFVVEALLKKLKIDRSVPRAHLKGGKVEAHRLLASFVQQKLKSYDEDRNEPAGEGTSLMSPYLHFGQISPLQIALATGDSEAYVEELIVRRELSMNFIHFNPKYDSYGALPAWAKRTLEKHASDKRETVYTLSQLEHGQTGDRYWNAAQLEMVRSGFMHNYMRMYWGKKILEWTKSPKKAYEIAMYLNNKYELDGRDANSYAGVGWIFGLHDRPWTERPIFGQVRYMNAAGLERKFDIEKYVEKVNALTSPPAARSRRRNA